jgi:hypothetical protein
MTIITDIARISWEVALAHVTKMMTDTARTIGKVALVSCDDDDNDY